MNTDRDADMDTAIDMEMDIDIPVLPKTSFQRFGCRILDVGKKFPPSSIRYWRIPYMLSPILLVAR
jgi:hypothetical protein